jgi:hypothetical protein
VWRGAGTPLDVREAAKPENLLRIMVEGRPVENQVRLYVTRHIRIISRPSCEISRMQPSDMYVLSMYELHIGVTVGDEQHLNPGSLV